MPNQKNPLSRIKYKKKNEISLLDDSNIDKSLKPIKVGVKNSILELSDSELKVRGTIDADAITVNGTSVQTGDDVGAVTAINNAATDRLVTIGATTTELEAESGLTYSSGTGELKIESSEVLYPQIKLVHSGSDYFSIDALVNCGVKLKTYDADSLLGHMDLESDGTMTLDANDDFTLDCEGVIVLDSNDNQIHLDNGGTRFGTINLTTASHLKLIATDDYDLSLITGGTGDINLTSGSGDIVATSTTALKPEFKLSNTTDDATCPIITLNSQRGVSDAQDDDRLGIIQFTGYDDGTPSTQTYGDIRVVAKDVSSGSEEGTMTFGVASNNGTLTSGFGLDGTSTSGKVDATLNGSLYLQEFASSSGNKAGYGQLWVDDEAPSRLMYTNDVGDQLEITGWNAGSSAGTQGLKAGIGLAGRHYMCSLTTLTQFNESEMNALHTTAKTIVPAQGASTVIIPTSIIAFCDRDASTAQSNGVHLYVGANESVTIGSGAWGYVKSFMSAESGDRTICFNMLNAVEIAQDISSTLVDRHLTCKLSGAITSGSIDSMVIATTYHVISIA